MNLISGKEALIALVNGEGVEARGNGGVWMELSTVKWSVHEILCGDCDFRLKPRTITINNIEVPAPFKPKEGDMVWFLNELHKNGYEARTAYDLDDLIVNIALWRTEDEIKQVVEALRSIFK